MREVLPDVVDHLLLLLQLLDVLVFLVPPQGLEHRLGLLVRYLVSCVPQLLHQVHERVVVPVFEVLHLGSLLFFFALAPGWLVAPHPQQ